MSCSPPYRLRMQGSPVGAILIYAGNSLDPQDQAWRICDGQQLSRLAYPELFAKIGDTYCPDKAVAAKHGIFHLPDLRGLFVRGCSPSHGLGTREASANKSHVHEVTDKGHDHLAAHSYEKLHTNCVQGCGDSGAEYLAKDDHSGHFVNLYTYAHPRGYGAEFKKPSNEVKVINTEKSPLVTSSSAHVTLQPHGEAEARPENLSLNYIIRVL